MTLDTADLGRRAEAMLDELAVISAEPDRLVRFFLSPEHRRAADLVAQWMREIGLEVFEDEIGNVRGRIGKPPYLILGSHIDTVIDAGRYDGPLGVVVPILAVDTLQRMKALPPLGIELVAFGDEEGSRFPSTLPSSAAMARMARIRRKFSPRRSRAARRPLSSRCTSSRDQSSKPRTSPSGSSPRSSDRRGCRQPLREKRDTRVPCR
jgi:hypothetical protein